MFPDRFLRFLVLSIVLVGPAGRLSVGHAWSAELAAELKLAAVFGDHMVLQQRKPVPVWGWAAPGERITVSFAGQEVSAAADDQGKWQVRLAELAASHEPRTLVVRGDKAGRERTVADVLVGEVWLGSGQSNMAMTVNRAQQFETEQATAMHPEIRMFMEESGAAPTVQPDGRGRWTVCSPETVGGFSATLYFFGREIHRALRVPVGLINSSVGGTPIESWIAADAQLAQPELRAAIETQQRAIAEADPARAQAQYERALERWKQQAAQAKAAGQTTPRRPVDPRLQQARRGGPGGLFNGKIAPLIPYAVRGVLWYQGEANSQPGKGYLYRHQLPLLVRDWRAQWGEELPFAWVQLPNFDRSGEGWMLVREAMLHSLQLPRTGMAITVDIGEPKDIHPRNKQDVGRRLAAWALGKVYDRQVPSTSGPLPRGHELRGAEVVITFDHADDGLSSNGEPVRGFVVAGADHQWHPATARIDGGRVIVTSPAVPQPQAARYGWAANPDANLRTGAGLPASPFRTDDWPVRDPAGS
ncbi:MAG: sialate O-acetylesterase [Pirellulaceae bacterium]